MGEIQNFDQILDRLETSKWNLFYFTVIAMFAFTPICNILGAAFLSPKVDYTCSVSQESGVVHISQCSYGVVGPNGTVVDELPCTSWTYNSSYFGPTVTSEFDLVCGREHLRTTFSSAYMLGAFVAAPITGFLSDKFGRYKVFAVSCIFYVLLSNAIAFLPYFALLCLARFLVGAFHPGMIHTGMSLGMEVCRICHRSAFGILVALPWALGTSWYGLLGYLIRDWRYLQLAASAPSILLLGVLWFFDESPRWLIVKGHHEKAKKILSKAAKWNKSSLPPDDELKAFMEATTEAAKKDEDGDCCSKLKGVASSAVVTVRTPEIRRRVLLMASTFFITSAVYYGISLNAVNYSADPFLYMIINGFVEIPSYTITAPIIKKFGRKWPTVISYINCGICLLAVYFVPKEMTWLVITIVMCGKVTLSAAYEIIYVYVAELVPTEVRLQVVGTCSFVSRIGGISSPYLTDYVGGWIPWLPSVIFGALTTVAGTFISLLPETVKSAMLETVDQLERQAKPNSQKDKMPINDTTRL